MSIKAGLINSVDLIKESISILKKDRSLWIVPILSFITLIILVPLFVLLTFPLAKSGIGGIILFLFLILFLIYLIPVFYNAALTWMVYQVKKGKDATLASGIKRAFVNFFDIILFSLFTFFVSILSSSIKRKNNFVRRSAAGAVKGIWSILGSLIMPSMIITENHFFRAWKDIWDYRKSIPQIIVGKFGLGMMYSIGFIIALLISFFMFTISLWLGVVSLLVLFVPLIIIYLLVKTTYFTLLYISVKKI